MNALLTGVRERLADGDSTGECSCVAEFETDRLAVDASECRADGRLASTPACRATVVDALVDRDADAVHVTTGGTERVYENDAAALLVAAGRFVERAAVHDERLAARARQDPLAAGREATGRADETATVAAESGLAELAARGSDYETVLAPRAGLAISDWRVETTVPPEAELDTVRELDTGSTVRTYRCEDGPNRYALDPVDTDLNSTEAALVAAAYERLANGTVTGGDRAPGRAVRQTVAAAVEGDPPDALAGATPTEADLSLPAMRRVLARHTRGHGLLEDFFADPEVSDAFLTAPAGDNPVRVRVDGRTLTTNVCLTAQGIEGLAARYRRESGRGFSRADPTLDAATTIAGRRVRVAGVTDPASDGTGFVFRAHDDRIWTLPQLVANDTLTAAAAALLSLSVERGAAVLVAGPRGSGKTTTLGALLPELPPSVRTVVIEDAPELPVERLQRRGWDVQALRASGEDGELSATESVRTALRLGDGALVVGEVRGEEAAALYEAMRVGANSEAVLGTIHGDGAAAVYDRVVDDLGVPPASFDATDLVVTLERTADGTRRLRAIEEVVDGEAGSFASLYDRTDGSLAATGRLDRGNARLLDTLARPGESYADVRAVFADRADGLAGDGAAISGAATR